ncbi:hypothetical protein [Desulfospira joergensenii]|uniref:hypothetical protein n=1 Tax=Desulfospira joergensenii TaxID=53329 RepID=UPI0003B34B73|nr:hypothetical protein [Desulfospira joergensenii]
MIPIITLLIVLFFSLLLTRIATVALIFRLWNTNVIALVFFEIIVLVAMVGRPLLLRWGKK